MNFKMDKGKTHRGVFYLFNQVTMAEDQEFIWIKAIEHQVAQFWSEIILMISNRTRAARSFNFEITRMISDQTAHHSV